MTDNWDWEYTEREHRLAYLECSYEERLRMLEEMHEFATRNYSPARQLTEEEMAEYCASFTGELFVTKT